MSRPASALAVLLVALSAGTSVGPPGASAGSPGQNIFAAAAAKGPLGHSGRWLTDRTGRVVILHGLNMVYKRPPYAPDATDFGADDARFLRRFGFNTIRLGVIYAGVEPQPGRYDERYLNRIARTERQLARRGVFTQLDFHQDLYNEKFGGEGWPGWAVLDDGQPADPLTGFPGSYISSPGLNRAFDNFWENEAGPGGIGVQHRYARAWRRVAARFHKRPRMMGYDLMNEPWPGSQWSSCANPEGCPAFDQGLFRAFYRRAFKAIRRADKRHLIWYEPNVLFDFGADTHLAFSRRRLGFSYHAYCLGAALGGGENEGCDTELEMVFGNADQHARETGSALLLSEFGATADNAVNRDLAERADRHMVSWQYWHYCGCKDPTTQAELNDQALVFDPARRPRGKNVDRGKLRALVRPYPQAIAGTPVRFGFDPNTEKFELVYSTRRPSGRGRFRRGVTDVFVPRLHYRRGYSASVKGGSVAVGTGQHLIIVSNRGARRVNVVVRPPR